MTDLLQWLLDIGIGLAISVVVAGFAYYKRSLSQSGLIAAILMGTTIYVAGGWFFIAVLFTFFVSSSVIPKLLHAQKKEDSMRTYKQVLANGIVGTVMAVLYLISDDDLFRLLFGISFAVSTADTWASELGRLSKKSPRHILTLAEVEPGRSGGITTIGTLSSIMGGLCISAFYMFHPVVIIGGFLGSTTDSILGTLQIKYVTKSGRVLDQPCPIEGYEEIKGLPFLSNNLVNLISNTIIVIVAYLTIPLF